jgi:hypothetical protein
MWKLILYYKGDTVKPVYSVQRSIYFSWNINNKKYQIQQTMFQFQV